MEANFAVCKMDGGAFSWDDEEEVFAGFTAEEKGKKTCAYLHPNLSSTKVNASPRKWVAKRNAS